MFIEKLLKSMKIPQQRKFETTVIFKLFTNVLTKIVVSKPGTFFLRISKVFKNTFQSSKSFQKTTFSIFQGRMWNI